MEKKKEIEPFADSTTSTIYGVFHFICFIFAFYLAFKCNDGFEITSFIAACCCPFLYIIFKYATDSSFCGMKSDE